jgi:site-specific DNA recombinase
MAIRKLQKDIYNELKQLEIAAIDEKEILQLYKKAINKMENIEKQFVNSDIDGKRRIIGSIFPKKFHFENKKVQTADVNPLFLKISSINRGSRGKKRDKS